MSQRNNKTAFRVDVGYFIFGMILITIGIYQMLPLVLSSIDAMDVFIVLVGLIFVSIPAIDRSKKLIYHDDDQERLR